jgi:hypothetical protein
MASTELMICTCDSDVGDYNRKQEKKRNMHGKQEDG